MKKIKFPRWFISSFPPHEPSKPVEPIDYYMYQDTIIDIDNGQTIGQFVEKIKALPPDSFFRIRCDADYHDSESCCAEDKETCSISIVGIVKVPFNKTQVKANNTNYAKALAKYEKDLAEYKTKIKEWKEYKKLWDEQEAEKTRLRELKMLESLKKKYEKEV